MRYKITNEPRRYNEEVTNRFFIMKEVKKWYSKKLKWKHVTENGYGGVSKVAFNDLNRAENYIKDMIKADNTSMASKDVKIYDTRENVINKLLDE